MKWTFKKYKHFGFFIPDKRDIYGGDFFVNKHNDKDAQDWDKVIASELTKSKWKKPEAKIIEILWKTAPWTKNKQDNICTWVYVQTTPEFWFIEVPWKDKGYFVHSSKKWGAKHGDKVKAELASYNGKQEWIITEILSSHDEIIEWELKDNWDFWFVFTKKWQDDIFISASNYNGAKNWDIVQVQVTRTTGRKPEGIIIQKKEAT